MTKISPEDIAVLNILIQNRDTTTRAAQGAINTYLFRCAQAHGLDPNTVKFSDSEMAFMDVVQELNLTKTE